MNLLSCPLFLQTQILILNKGKELNPNLKEGKRKRKSRERDRNVGKMRISEEGLGVRSKVMVLVYLEFSSVFYHLTSFFMDCENLHLHIYNCTFSMVDHIITNTSPIKHSWFIFPIFWSFFVGFNKMRFDFASARKFVGNWLAGFHLYEFFIFKCLLILWY